MVLPKRHVVNMKDLTKEESSAILSEIEYMQKIIEDVYKKSPLIFINRGKHPTQDHLHFHIIPLDEGIRDLVSKSSGIPTRKKASKEELEIIKNEIKKSMSNLKSF